MFGCTAQEETPADRRKREREDAKSEREAKRKNDFDVRQATLAVSKIQPSLMTIEAFLERPG